MCDERFTVVRTDGARKTQLLVERGITVPGCVLEDAFDKGGAMGFRRGNLESDIPTELPEELVNTLASGSRSRVERIVSRGHVTPSGAWYDQDEHEWVCVVSGGARVEIEGRGEPVHLGPGDWIEFRAHVRHRVVWTLPETDTIWLAVFFSDDA
jgi:cupin 2 domain-containing protein